MNVYKTEDIRNIVLLGHGSAGKTTVAEAMALLAGLITRMGTVTGGNTISDFDKEEQKRGFSLSAAVIPIEWNKKKVNIIDTPGYFDFVGEAEEGVSAADGAVIVVSGKAGVQTGTIKAWELCEKYNMPRMIFITDMDLADANFDKTVESLKDAFGQKIAPMVVPIREGEKLVGYVDVIRHTASRYLEAGKRADMPIPASVEGSVESCHDTLMENVAETSEDFMERYFGGDEFTEDEISDALHGAVAAGEMAPVYMGCGATAHGIFMLLNDIISYMPSPAKRGVKGTLEEGGTFDADYDEGKAKTAYIWKTMVDPFIGKYSFVKVMSGVLKTDDSLVNQRTSDDEKIGKLYLLQGNKTIEVPELHAGDIGALAKLNDAKTGDTYAEKGLNVSYPVPEFTKPYTYMRYIVPNKGEDDKVSAALARLSAEDITLKVVNDSANGQMLLYAVGDQALDIVKSKLLARYKVQIELESPRVAFKETITRTSDVQGKHKKQSGGHGQYGDVRMRFSNSGDNETPFVFDVEVVGGTVPRNFWPAVEKGLQESVVRGPLAGYPVVGVKAVLYDGSYHPVDSSEQAFKTATSLAFKDGFMKAGPVLLEPIMNLKVTVPNDFTGDVMGDLNKRRGRVLGMNPIAGGKQVVEAEIPEMELFGYCTVLRSMTGGIGSYEVNFDHYEQAPRDVQEKEVAKKAAEDKE
ncbi:MAG: elongation factor G [Lachnospiraceae bacterium]|nr:elongation factor G [Lachnospiraceae bacterium]